MELKIALELIKKFINIIVVKPWAWFTIKENQNLKNSKVK